MSTSSSLLSLLSEPLLTGALLLTYNTFTGSGVTQQSLMDAAYLSAANLVANVLNNLFFASSSTLTTLFGTTANTTMIEQSFIIPILTSIMYVYAYDHYYRQTYNLSGNRTSNMSYIISFITTAISDMYAGSIFSLLTTTFPSL